MAKCDFQPSNIGGVKCSVCGHQSLAPHERECSGEQVKAMTLEQTRALLKEKSGCCGQPIAPQH